VLGSEVDFRMLERVEKHGKAIDESTAAETERTHKGGCQDCCVSSVTIAEETLEGSEEFQVQRVYFLSCMYEGCLGSV
jgi:hypothetical protein